MHEFFNALFNLEIRVFIGLEIPTESVYECRLQKKAWKKVVQQKMNFDRLVEVCFKQESGTIKSSGLY